MLPSSMAEVRHLFSAMTSLEAEDNLSPHRGRGLLPVGIGGGGEE